MAAVYPSQYNTFIPNLEGSRRLLVDFSRNPRDFSVNRYATLVPCPNEKGYYVSMTVEERMRILSTADNEHNWPDSSDRPAGHEGQESHNFIPFTCVRKAFNVSLGRLATDQALWDMIGQHSEIKAQQAMTSRTQAVVTAATTSGNYNAAHTATTTAAGGGTWDAATTASPYIRKSINYAVDQILLSTGAVVKADQMHLVLDPTLAKEAAESQEMIDFIKGSPTALAYLRGETSEGNQKNKLFGLPPTYGGVDLVVEDAVKVTSKKGETVAQSYVLPAATPFIASRPGGLVGKYGGPSFSTVTLFVYEGDDLTVETLNDTNNRRTLISVVDNRAAAVTASISGFLFTGAT